MSDLDQYTILGVKALPRLRRELGDCPMGDWHDLRGPIYGPLRRATLVQQLDSPEVSGARVIIGYSCNKCHKTWDKDWVATWEKL